MSFFSALYRLLIGPLELFFEILFSMVNHVVDNPGLSIIGLSLVMNFLVLPLYKRADAMQEEERQTNERLKHWTAHIKKTFKGDERFMILQTYYRQNNYKPTNALKGSVSLLLEIPFFMAAYNFLSGLPLLYGAALGPIQNLGEPDGLLVIGGLAINILPILMTAINLVSSAIYTKGLPTKSKVQLYVMAGLFLVLLYDSPAGLVFYWTLNNLFSLAKNIFMKLRNPQKVFCGLCSVTGAAALAFVVVTHPMPTARSQFLLCCLTLMMQLPMVVYLIAKRLPHSGKEVILNKKDHATFWVCGLFMTVLTGVFIPTGVISASPEEFINTVTHTSPLIYILSSTLTAAGFFLIWFGIFYMLASNSGKKWMSYGLCALSVVSVVDFMCFGLDYGNMSANLVFDTAPVYTHKLLNLLVIALAIGIVYVIWKKKQDLLRFVFFIAALAAVVTTTVDMVQIQNITSDKIEQLQETVEDPPIIHLSKNGKNVIVLMMDYGVGAYVPYIMNEKPILHEQFAGFTYYPNTISFGGHTNFGAPSLFGGYEYTPEQMNLRDQESLSQKHNEALKVMPLIFANEGYHTTVCDPPYAGYSMLPDLSIYNEYPNIHKFNSMGKFGYNTNSKDQDYHLRNLFCYSLFKAVPVTIQSYFYDGGQYNNTGDFIHQTVNSPHIARGCNSAFLRAYSVLENLSNMTAFSDETTNTFLMLTNDTTHEPTMLQKPDYLPAENVDNTLYDQSNPELYTLNGKTLKMEKERSVMHYHVNVAAFLKLGEWFDYLRKNDVFDNTRIIIVSDHGAPVRQLDGLSLGSDKTEDILNYNPLLLVKDFNSTEFSVDNAFMTNADTTTLAFDSLIADTQNPFTGKIINNSAKYTSAQHVLCSHEFSILENDGNTYIPGPWYSVHDNIFDANNWEYLGVR